MSDVWVKVKMPSELHGKFRLWSFENRCSMQGAILAWIEKVCSASKTPVEAPKRPSVKPEVVVKGIERGLGGDPVKSPVASMEIHDARMAKCRHCYDVFPVADMVTDKKTGWLFCSDCVDNMKGGQV